MRNALRITLALAPLVLGWAGLGFAGAAVQAGPDNPITPGPAPGCISTASPCLTVPVKIQRTDAVPIRGYSITVQLSPELEICSVPATSFSAGGYLANSDFHVLALGGGSYTVDEATLGLPCGATGDGTLFNIKVKSALPGGTGTITVTAVILRDCGNVSVPGSTGAPLAIEIDQVAPGAVSLVALQKLAGNIQPPDGTTDIMLTWTGQEAGSSLAIYRKGFGGYPQYDENGGATPSPPATPAAAVLAGWTLTGVTAMPATDRSAVRDFYYYVAFVTDACGNVSPASAMTPGTLNYHLGDAHDGVADCQGNDVVNTSDIAFLGLHYGVILPANDPLECLDVGPTTNFSVLARPTTDNRIQFEDLVLFAINYGQVSAPQVKALPAPAAANTLRLRVPALPGLGETFEVGVEMEGAGDIQGLSVELAYERAVVEPVGVEAGGLLGQQGSPGVVLSSGAGNVDVALLGPGYGLRGGGEVARVRFRVRGSGEAGVGLEAVQARDGANRPVGVSMGGGAGEGRGVGRTGLGLIYPNPMQSGTTIQLSLRQGVRVKLGVYDVTGRRVRQLVEGMQGAGEMRVSWDGRSDAGVGVASGFYVLRLEAGDLVQTRQLRVVR